MNATKAIELYTQGAAHGSLEAKYNLAHLYLVGAEGVPAMN